jgi:methyl-accepting chemotaxis protein WspA
LTISRPQLIVEGLMGTTDPPTIARRLDDLKAMENEYQARYDYWTKSALDPEIKDEIAKCNKPVDEYFRLINSELAPALRQNQTDKAKKVFDERLKPCFDAYQDTYKKAMLRIHDMESSTQTLAAEAAKFWMSWMVILSAVAVISIGLLGWLTTRSITRSTENLLGRVREMAGGAGDLTARVEIDSSDELAQLAAGINAMIAKIQSVVERVREGSVQLLSTSAQIAATAKQQQGTVQGLSSATTEIAAAVREISATSDALAGTMAEVSSGAGQAAALAAAGREGLDGIETTMQQLMDSTDSISVKLGVVREKAESINAVVTTITKVADQTNLLSINAAIEAEKAGEYGRGFLVVAREIRRLADQTAIATLDIENMVRLMQDAVSAGVMQMDKFGGEFRSGMDRIKEINGQTGRIIEDVEGVTSRFQAVNEGMHSQSVAARQINEAIVPVANGTKETQVSLEEFIKATAYLRQSVELLNQEIAQFKV